MVKTRPRRSSNTVEIPGGSNLQRPLGRRNNYKFNMIKKSFVLLAALFLAAKIFASGDVALVPLPQKVQRLDGSFTLTSQTHIYADWSSRKTAIFLPGET